MLNVTMCPQFEETLICSRGIIIIYYQRLFLFILWNKNSFAQPLWETSKCCYITGHLRLQDWSNNKQCCHQIRNLFPLQKLMSNFLTQFKSTECQITRIELSYEKYEKKILLYVICKLQTQEIISSFIKSGSSSSQLKSLIEIDHIFKNRNSSNLHLK